MRALDFERENDVREELPREEALPEEVLREEALRETPVREEAPRDGRDPVELRLALPDLVVSFLLEALLLLEPLLLLELPAEPLLDLLLPDRAFAEDDRAPDEREELLFFDLPLDFEGMGISFSLAYLVR